MEAIILSGGRGTRLRGITDGLPKPMVSVGGRPFLSFVFDMLLKNGVTRVILCIGSTHQVIKMYYGAGYCGLRIEYSIEHTPLGTGGAIKKALDLCEEDHAFVINGDSLTKCSLVDMEEIWEYQKSPIMLTRYVSDTCRYGRLDIEGDKLKGFLGKGYSGAGYINAGYYLLPTNLLAGIDKLTFSFEEYYLPVFSVDSEFICVNSDDYFIDIGVPEDYVKAQFELGNLEKR